jgi:hypothetical protein
LFSLRFNAAFVQHIAASIGQSIYLSSKQFYEIISLILAFFLLIVNIYSQNRTVTGTIVDQNGAPIPNATVL